MLNMLDKEDLLFFERKFSDLNIVTSILLIFYYLFFVLFSKLYLVNEFHVIIFFILLILADAVLIHYYSNHKFFDIGIKILKLLMLISLGYAAVLSRGSVYSTFIIAALYISIVFQSLFLFDITESLSKKYTLILTCGPISIIYMIDIMFVDLTDFMALISVFALFALCVIIYNITCRLSELVILFYKKINALNDIALSNQEENDNIKIQKNKLEHINGQLSIERFKLKQANDIITSNNEEIKIQNTIVNATTKALDIQRLLEYITDATIVSLKIDLVIFLIVCNDIDDEKNFISSSKYSRESSVGKGNLDLIENIQFAKNYIENGAIIDIPQNANQEIDCLTGTKINSLMMTPIVINKSSMGLYILGSVEKKSLKRREQFLNSLFSHITLAINNALLYSKMHTMATKDVLTGIYNRRYFNSIYATLIKKCLENSSPLTIILFDIDRFKKINDTYGHIFGDEVISYCGHIALEYGKQYDGFPVRYGGEEFVIVFPHKNTLEVEAIMKEMHATIKKYKFDIDDKKISINISIGIASYPENCDNTNELLNAVDNAMYYSKKKGRGRITIYNEDIIA